MPTAALSEEDKPSKSLLTWHCLSAQTDVFNLKEKKLQVSAMHAIDSFVSGAC